MDLIIEQIISFVANPQVILIGGVIVEFVLRFSKTEKPKSIILAVASIAKSVGNGLVAVSEFLNKIVPQRLK
jgi:hypothetical protein